MKCRKLLAVRYTARDKISPLRSCLASLEIHGFATCERGLLLVAARWALRNEKSVATRIATFRLQP